ncbi:MAG TPA: outer membrane lipoprotein-sorting protein [Flavobacteriaceae bacterium]|jgi:outer membrane lipoprotein-sorting protein|nr:outer membrane lipoprotein-sorting protein [Flavobacteriaceae bacterium]HJO70105.1 outer membrane lipoprotein-sorting protein [Flavobacteriaceae bacterium]|tara:strand:+ start:336 stop:1094 length:759 start_codon:yes stop_codon:yes gene_type:complete
MKTISKILIVAILSISPIINAQTVDEIISNYFENTGGIENWEMAEGIKMSGKMIQGEIEIPIEIVQLKNKMMTKITIQGITFKDGVFDGETLWSTNFMTQKAERKNQEEADIIKNDLEQFPDPFLNYKEKGYTVELLGKETVDGTETFKVKLTTKPNIIEGKEVPSISIYFFDSENFVPILMHEEIQMGPGKGLTVEVKMSDYQEVGGLYMPFSLTQGIKGQPGAPIVIDSIELNPSVDDSEFAFPEDQSIE